MVDPFYSVDWGTTRLRVRLVDRGPFRVVAERCGKEGAAVVDAAWREAGGSADRLRFFADRLAAIVATLAPDGVQDAAGIPIVVSGMASSSIGMRELPYATAPVAQRRDDFVVSVFDQLGPFRSGLILVSGVATADDVVRGEETEWLGLVEQGYSDGLYLLPGTHSKHLTVVNARLTGIQTFLTGELFDVLSRSSVLAEVVAADEPVTPGLVFLESVREACGSAGAGLLGQLFSVRARALLAGAARREGAERLSGLLIGAEVATLPKAAPSTPHVLSGHERLRPLYAAALKEIGAPFTAVGKREQSEAVPRAHARLLDWLA